MDQHYENAPVDYHILSMLLLSLQGTICVEYESILHASLVASVYVAMARMPSNHQKGCSLHFQNITLKGGMHIDGVPPFYNIHSLPQPTHRRTRRSFLASLNSSARSSWCLGRMRDVGLTGCDRQAKNLPGDN